MFTRRHYRAIAEIFKVNYPGNLPRESERRYHHQYIIDQLANMFACDNSNFQWDRFVEATLPDRFIKATLPD